MYSKYLMGYSSPRSLVSVENQTENAPSPDVRYRAVNRYCPSTIPSRLNEARSPTKRLRTQSVSIDTHRSTDATVATPRVIRPRCFTARHLTAPPDGSVDSSGRFAPLVLAWPSLYRATARF